MLDSTNELAKSLFDSTENMKNFLLLLSKMYNTSYSNLLLLKAQKNGVSFVADKETMKKCNFHIKDGEEPLKVIKRIKINDEVKFKIDKIYDISQTDAVKKQEQVYSKEYIEMMLKGMCSRRGIRFEPNNPMINLENIIINIKDNSRINTSSMYDVDQYASQTEAEVEATIFACAKTLNINTTNYDLKYICKWGIDKDPRTLKESLKYIQKYTNYFVNDFKKQEKLYNIENEKQEDEELE